MFRKKTNASTKSKPSQFMAILGITAVLFIVGIFGWLFISASKYTEVLKEDVMVQVYLHQSATEKTTNDLQAYLQSQPYLKDVEFISKERAKEIMQASEDRYDESIIGGQNYLPASLNFHVKSNYVQKDSLLKIKEQIFANGNNTIESILYPVGVVEKMGPTLRWVLIGLAILALIFTILCFILIDNTIKLSMYSNRFLIKTMQMVGATRSFIVKPINKQAVYNALIAASIAIACVSGLIYLSENIPEVRQLRDNKNLMFLFLGVVCFGVLISLFSTHRSVIKYLKMKLDDLY